MKKIVCVAFALLLPVTGLADESTPATGAMPAIARNSADQVQSSKFQYLITNLEGKERPLNIDSPSEVGWVAEILAKAKEHLLTEIGASISEGHQLEIEFVSIPAEHDGTKLNTTYLAMKYDLGKNAARFLPFAGQFVTKKYDIYVRFDVRLRVDGKKVEKVFSGNEHAIAEVTAGDTLTLNQMSKLKDSLTPLFLGEVDKVAKSAADYLKQQG